MTFVLVQLPLVLGVFYRLSLINIRQVLHMEIVVVILGVIIGLILKPSPAIGGLVAIIIPVIALYQLSPITLWLLAFSSSPNSTLNQMLEQDKKTRLEREQRILTMEYVWHQSDLTASLARLPDGLLSPEAIRTVPVPVFDDHSSADSYI